MECHGFVKRKFLPWSAFEVKILRVDTKMVTFQI